MSDLDLSKPVRARQEFFVAVKIATLSGVAEVAATAGSPCPARVKRNGWVSPRGDTSGDTHRPLTTNPTWFESCYFGLGLSLKNSLMAASSLEEFERRVILTAPLRWSLVSFATAIRRARHERGVDVGKRTLIYERRNKQNNTPNLRYGGLVIRRRRRDVSHNTVFVDGHRNGQTLTVGRC